MLTITTMETRSVSEGRRDWGELETHPSLRPGDLPCPIAFGVVCLAFGSQVTVV